MSAFILPRLFTRPVLMGATLGLGLYTTHSILLQPSRSLRLDTSAFSSSSYSQNARVPILSPRGRKLNPSAVRQISSGSIIGLVGGLLISTFSRSLALIIGLLVLGTQYASSQFGINVIPTERIQRYFRNVDVKGVVRDNVAFKVAFGVTFALAGFASL